MVFCYGSLMVFLFSGSAVVPPTKGSEKGICSKNLWLQPNCYEKQKQTHDKHKNCKEKPEDGQKVYAYANCGGGQLQFAKQNLTEDVKAKHISTIATFGFSTLIVMLFMYIQKRVHKEVFLEIRQRVSQQDEFKTIFN